MCDIHVLMKRNESRAMILVLHLLARLTSTRIGPFMGNIFSARCLGHIARPAPTTTQHVVQQAARHARTHGPTADRFLPPATPNQPPAQRVNSHVAVICVHGTDEGAVNCWLAFIFYSCQIAHQSFAFLPAGPGHRLGAGRPIRPHRGLFSWLLSNPRRLAEVPPGARYSRFGVNFCSCVRRQKVNFIPRTDSTKVFPIDTY